MYHLITEAHCNWQTHNARALNTHPARCSCKHLAIRLLLDSGLEELAWLSKPSISIPSPNRVLISPYSYSSLQPTIFPSQPLSVKLASLLQKKILKVVSLPQSLPIKFHFPSSSLYFDTSPIRRFNSQARNLSMIAAAGAPIVARLPSQNCSSQVQLLPSSPHFLHTVAMPRWSRKASSSFASILTGTAFMVLLSNQLSIPMRILGSISHASSIGNQTPCPLRVAT